MAGIWSDQHKSEVLRMPRSLEEVMPLQGTTLEMDGRGSMESFFPEISNNLYLLAFNVSLYEWTHSECLSTLISLERDKIIITGDAGTCIQEKIITIENSVATWQLDATQTISIYEKQDRSEDWPLGYARHHSCIRTRGEFTRYSNLLNMALKVVRNPSG